MKVPISWLKEFVDIKMPVKDLMWKMTEAGLTTEAYEKHGREIILDVEVTPNRPDWLSIIGIAQDIAALSGKRAKALKLRPIPKKKSGLKITILNDFELCPRYSYVIIKNVKQKPSPKWLAERLEQVGLRPINNLVDISNYVMFETGNPIHVFDYDKLQPKELTLTLSKGGEEFVSVDGKKYLLPKGAIVFTNGDNIVDLCGIKGGINSGVTEGTKNILLLVPIYNGIYVRRTAQHLALFSDASKIFERGANVGGTLDTLKRAINLTLDSAGGQIGSPVVDNFKRKFEPWKLSLSLERLDKVLGIKVPNRNILSILKSLGLSPKLTKNEVTCVIPTRRGDLRIEEDLIEEVARIYGYNKFTKTLPTGTAQGEKVPYYFDDSFHIKLKNLFVGVGFSEIMTYSLTSLSALKMWNLDQRNNIHISNPVSSDYEYMRNNLLMGLMGAVKLNADNTKLKLFELGKVYWGSADKPIEKYLLGGAASGYSFREFKGVVDLVFERLNVTDIEIEENRVLTNMYDGARSAIVKHNGLIVCTYGCIDPSVLEKCGLNIKKDVFAFEFDLQVLESLSKDILFKAVPKYPPQIEDMTITLPTNTKIGDLISAVSRLEKVFDVRLKGVYGGNSTFRIWYQSPTKTLTNKEVEKIREKIIKIVSEKFGGTIKA